MNEVFEKNIESLKAARPDIAEKLQSEIEIFEKNPEGNDDETFRIVPGANATKNLVYVRRSPSYQALIHRPDGISEALKVIRETNMYHPQLVMILGCGLGYLLNEFLRMRTKTTFGVILIEKNPQIFLRALCVLDWKPIFEDTSVHLAIGIPLNVMKGQILSFFEHFSTVDRSVKVLCTPSAKESEPDYYADTLRLVIPARDEATVWCGNSVEDSYHGLQNVLNNIERLVTNRGITPLYNLFEGKTCISLAAGPSLNEAWDWIRKLQGKIPIIACDTVLKPLNAHGIQADFITALERDPIVADMFRGQPVPERTSLFGPNLLLPESFECFQGRHIIYCATPGYNVNLGFNFLGVFGPGSSAGNVNLSLATHMGFENIIMVGHNLAFAHGSNESHVKGTIEKAREQGRTEEEISRIATGGKVPTADGTAEVYTITEYNLFRKQIERWIAANPKKKFINTSAKGAKIEGADFMPLGEAIEKYAQGSFDCFPSIQEKYGPVPDDEVARKTVIVRRRLRTVVEALSEGETVANEMVEKLSDWEAEIQAGEDSGHRVTIPVLNERLDEVLKTKVKMVNERPDFSAAFINVISPAHMAFERTVNALMGRHKDNYELKKDFLLKHKQYFQIWKKWLTPIMGEYRKALDRLEARNDLAEAEAKVEAEIAAIPEEVPLQSNLQR